jgi:5' nucleotidase, deoxy (Pyrimidine), cytosolic type C protein (NT5C)
MLVGLDIDGVVADFLGPFLRFVETQIGCAPIAPETVVDLSYKDHPVITDTVLERCLEALAAEPDFFDRLIPLLTASEWRALDGLSRARRLVFITHRQAREGRDVQRLTADWLKRHGISDPVVHCTADYKSKLVAELGVAAFVDDRPENCLDVAENTRAMVYMPRRNYNAFFTHPKVKTFDRFGELLGYFK